MKGKGESEKKGGDGHCTSKLTATMQGYFRGKKKVLSFGKKKEVPGCAVLSNDSRKAQKKRGKKQKRGGRKRETFQSGYNAA